MDREADESPALEYPIVFTTPGTYNVWVRMRGIDRDSDSLHVGFETHVTGLNGIRQNDSLDWLWIGEVPGSGQAQVVVGEPGVRTFRVWPREDAVELDRIVLALDSEIDPAAVPNSPTDGDPDAARIVRACAGENRTFAGSNLLSLDGSGSTGPITTYEWEALSTNSEFLDEPNVANPRISLTRTGNYLFRLRAGNALGQVDEDFVTIRYEALEANAGPNMEVVLGEPIVLDGRDSLGTVAAASWEVIGSSPDGTVEDPHSIWTTLAPAAPGTFTIRLTITGAEGSLRSDDVVVQVNPNRPILHESQNPFIGFQGYFAIEAEDFDAQALGTGAWQDHTWTVESDSEASSGTYMRNSPDIDLQDDIAIDSPGLEYPIQVQYQGAHEVRLRLRGNSNSSVHLGIPHVTTSANGIVSTQADWHWSPPIDVRLPFGPTTLRLWPQDDGVEIDRIVLTYKFLEDPITDPDLVPDTVRQSAYPPPPSDGINVRAIAGDDITVTLGEDFTLDGTASTGPITNYQWTILSPGVRVLNRSSILTRSTSSLGTRECVLQVTNAEGESHFDSLTVTVLPDTNAYDAWATTVYPSDMRDLDDDPEGDGYSNGLAFLLGATSTQPNPAESSTTRFVDGCLVYSHPFRRENGFNGSLRLELSHDHRHWTSDVLGLTRPWFFTEQDYFGPGIDRMNHVIWIQDLPRLFVRLSTDLP